jgi:hypothetical protein
MNRLVKCGVFVAYAYQARIVSVDPILLGLDRQIQAKGGDLAHLPWRPVPGIPSEHFWIYESKDQALRLYTRIESQQDSLGATRLP